MKECCQQAAQAAWDEGYEAADDQWEIRRLHDPGDMNPYRTAEVPATPEEPPALGDRT